MRKGFNFYRSYYDVAKELSEKDRLLFLWAVLEKQFEGKEPNLKGMSNFAYLSQKHNIDSQVVGYELKTGTKLGGTGGGSVGGAEQGKGKGKGKGKGEDEGKDKEFNFKSTLLEIAKEDLVNDWLIVRKNKKASNTKTAYLKFMSEVEKCPKDINEILEICITKSWSGFNHEWLKNIPEFQTPINNNQATFVKHVTDTEF